MSSLMFSENSLTLQFNVQAYYYFSRLTISPSSQTLFSIYSYPPNERRTHKRMAGKFTLKVKKARFYDRCQFRSHKFFFVGFF